MRVTWRGLELPTRVEKDVAVSKDKYGRFFVEPFERGFGTTVGNSLRRVLLSSLEGSAVTSIKIAGVEHEFTSLPGVMEDTTDIVLNVKSLVIRLQGRGPKAMKVSAKKAGPVMAADIVADPAIEVISKDTVLATLTENVRFEMEMEVENGRGYVPVSERIADADRFEQEMGRAGHAGDVIRALGQLVGSMQELAHSRRRPRTARPAEEDGHQEGRLDQPLVGEITQHPQFTEAKHLELRLDAVVAAHAHEFG